VYDVASGERVTVARGPVGAWDAVAIAEPELVEWHAADGTLLHGRLYRAADGGGDGVPADAGEPARRAPMVVLVHGGPTGQTAITFLPRVVHLNAQGWSVFVPDHRGSSGWGRGYQQAMNGSWGELDTADVIDGVRHCVDAGWCDPSRIVAMGGSAGGFCALNLVRDPSQLFAGVVALYPVTDLQTIDDTTHRFERHYTARVVGDRAAYPERYRERSPLTDPASITVPLLLFHGDADESVDVGQSRSLVAALRALGREAELVEYAGEGHGWKRPESTLDEVARTDAFLRHLRPRAGR
jgi:dipeptidyl aminopeptidase/acylaminoacyl peptidase